MSGQGGVPRQIEQIISGTFPTFEQRERWWNAENRYLQWRSPCDVWGAGNRLLVLEAAEAYVVGAPI